MAFGRDVEFGALVGYLRGLELRLLGQFVAEADAVIEQAKAQVHRMAAPAFVLADAHETFVIMIADIAALAPRLLPPVVAARALRPFDGEAALETDAFGQQDAELRRRDQQLALARHRPGRARVLV